MDMIEQIITLPCPRIRDSEISPRKVSWNIPAGSGVIVAKQDCILAGTDAAEEHFRWWTQM